MHKAPTHSIGRRRRVTALVIIILLVVIAFALTVYITGHRLKSEYDTFIAAEADFETAANKPASGSNPVRQQVGYLLSQVVQVTMSPEERLKLSREGIAHLNDLEGQIDAIQTAGERVSPLLDTLAKTASSPVHIQKRAGLNEIIALSRKNALIIADIRGLSYRADYYTDEVFERIIDDQGNMTDEHKTHLNDLIPDLETQFNRRTNLYTDLKKNSDRIHAIAKDLGYAVQ